MAQQKIRFEDDLWYIRRVTALVEDAVKIQPDPEFFAEHILGEACFAEGLIRKFLDLLDSSPHLMDRAEYLVLLSRSARSLSDSASALAAGQGDLGQALADRRDEITAIAQRLKAAATEIRDKANKAMDERLVKGDVVSGDELSELLKDTP